MRYSIGLDIGIASVGYAIIMLDGNDEPARILKLGSRIFDIPENPDDGASLAAPRREKRGIRRLLRRKRFRKERIKKLIEKNNIMTLTEISEIYNKSKLDDIYEIRYRAVYEKINKEEFVRLLIHLSERRGFKSNRKVDSKNKKSDDGALLTAIKQNEELLHTKGYRTIGEMLFKDEKFASFKRNKQEKYENTFSRKNYEDEIKYIFKIQRENGNEFASEEFEKAYLDIYLSQRAFDEGPGGNSPYGGNQIEKMLGKCTFENDEFRAVKASFSFEYFNLLSKINSIKVGSPKRFLTQEERRKIKEKAFKTQNLTYESLRNEIALPLSEDFNISYNENSMEDVEKKTKFTYLNAYHTFKKAYGSVFDLWDNEKKNNLAYALTVYKNDNKIREYLTEKGFEPAEIDIALTLPSFSKTANLSVKAIDKIIPYLEQGMQYNEACECAGYNFKSDDKSIGKFLPANPDKALELQTLNNPVVRRSVSQTIKVVNAIIREMDESPVFVNIEVARELAKNFKDRKDIEKKQKKRKENNEGIMQELRDIDKIIQPSGQDLIKLKLWKEQDGICPYSLKKIPRERLFEGGFAEIDHIIPYSLSFDDSYNNKVLVLSAENRQKGNRIPMEYLSGKRQDDFYVWVENSNLTKRKRLNLLKEKLTEEDLSQFKKRNLQDTKYICRFMLNYIKKYLMFAPNNSGLKNTVKAVSGAATDYVRKRWGIKKIRENGDTHHAVDAVVIACITNGMIRRISEYSKYRENRYVDPDTGEIFDIDTKTGEIIDRFPMPYKWFRDELEILCSNNPTKALHDNPLPNYGVDEPLKPIFVSRMSKHKVTGKAHKDTIRKPYEDNEGIQYEISKVKLEDLKMEKGEIKNYYNPSSDLLLYNALKKRLEEFDGNAKKAFAEPFYKPKSDGSPGPVVKKVKTIEKATLTVPVLQGNGIADNGSMVRTDVFYVENEGYYLVPIYVSDTVKDKLPNKAIIAHKPYSDWKVMDDKDFLFSLYSEDLIKIKKKEDIKFSLVNTDSTLPKDHFENDCFVYYKGCNISTASISFINHDNTYKASGVGVKTLVSLEKYRVDILGNITKVKKERREGFR